MTTQTISLPATPAARPRRVALRRILWVTLLIGLIVAGPVASVSHLLIRRGWTTYPLADLTASGDWIQAAAFDTNGQPWVGTHQGRLFKLSRAGAWSELPPIGNAEGIACLAVDGQGYLWAATEVDLWRLGASAWKHFDKPNSSLTHLKISALAVDALGRLWVGHRNDFSGSPGINVLYPNGQWTTYTLDNSGLADDRVNVLAADPQGRMWIGTPDTLSVFDAQQRWTNYTTDNSELAESVVALAFDAHGNTWVGEQGARQLLDANGHWTTPSAAGAGAPEYDYGPIAIDQAGRVWRGDAAGLNSQSSDAHWAAYTQATSGWVEQSVLALAIDKSGRVWAAGSHSVVVLDPSRVMPPLLGSLLVLLRFCMLLVLAVCAVAFPVLSLDALLHLRLGQGQRAVAGQPQRSAVTSCAAAVLELAAGAAVNPLIWFYTVTLVQFTREHLVPEAAYKYMMPIGPALILIALLVAALNRRWLFLAGLLGVYFANITIGAAYGGSVCGIIGVLITGINHAIGFPFWEFFGERTICY